VFRVTSDFIGFVFASLCGSKFVQVSLSLVDPKIVWFVTPGFFVSLRPQNSMVFLFWFSVPFCASLSVSCRPKNSMVCHFWFSVPRRPRNIMYCHFWSRPCFWQFASGYFYWLRQHSEHFVCHLRCLCLCLADWSAEFLIINWDNVGQQ